jgi:hypothetical protein
MGTDAQTLPNNFSWTLRLYKILRPSRFQPVLCMTQLPGLTRLDGQTSPQCISQSVILGFRYRTPLYGTGILTCFPFVLIG